MANMSTVTVYSGNKKNRQRGESMNIVRILTEKENSYERRRELTGKMVMKEEGNYVE